jgi:hypothetical protein
MRREHTELDPARSQCEARTMRNAVLTVLVLSGAAACGGDDGGSGDIDAPGVDAPSGGDGGNTDAAIDGPGIDAPPAALALTSTAIVEGGVIADMYSCQGVNVSPPLAWTGGPSAAGYAIVFTDISPGSGLVHSVIWDIPPTTMSLPENVEKVYMPATPAGAKQPLGYDGATRGYLGPCPGSMHTYQFALYAVDQNPLTDANGTALSMSTTRNQARTAILAHDTAMATLTATFTP